MSSQIAVVIPSYRVKAHIAPLITRIGSEVTHIYVVDDCCPEQSGEYVKQHIKDPRVRVIMHEKNLGVGGAVVTGYKAALADGVDVVIKIDGDGQMAPELIPTFVAPILSGEADYTKGNRFFSLEYLNEMPKIRVFGNTVLSFVSKASSGYWNVMDPTNGYTAIHCAVLSMLPLDKIHQRYFFESDMLFRLNTVRAVVADIPMKSVYADEESGLKIGKVAVEFPGQYGIRIFKRIFYNYFLRDFNICSLQIVFGTLLFTLGALYGGYHWLESYITHTAAATGTIILSSLLIILGFQLLLSAVIFDAMNIPTQPLQKRLQRRSL
jgi:dolichol-phosphate mannosyltransferase